MATRLPLELKLEIVEELHASNDNLSTVSFLWPETIPLIRRYRFKEIKIGAAGPSHIPLSLEKLLLIIKGAPKIAKIVQTLTFVNFEYPAHTEFVRFELDTDMDDDYETSFERRMFYVYSSRSVIYLLSLTTSLESISFDGLFLTMLPQFHRIQLFAVLSTLPRVHTLVLRNFYAERLSHLDDLLHSLPHVTTLTMTPFVVGDLHWMQPPDLDGGAFWMMDDIQHLDWNDPTRTPHITFGPFPNIVSLDFGYETPTGCIFIDMIPAAPLCLFPNLEILTFNFKYLSERSYSRLRSLLLVFHSSLKHLDIREVTSAVHGTRLEDILVLPRNLEVLEFSLVDTDTLSNCARWFVEHARKADTIPLDTIKITVNLDAFLSLGVAQLAQAMIPMDAALSAPALGVRDLQLDVYYDEAPGEVFEEVFPLIQKRFFAESERQVVGEIRWSRF